MSTQFFLWFLLQMTDGKHAQRKCESQWFRVVQCPEKTPKRHRMLRSLWWNTKSSSAPWPHNLVVGIYFIFGLLFETDRLDSYPENMMKNVVGLGNEKNFHLISILLVPNLCLLQPFGQSALCHKMLHFTLWKDADWEQLMRTNSQERFQHSVGKQNFTKGRKQWWAPTAFITEVNLRQLFLSFARICTFSWDTIVNCFAFFYLLQSVFKGFVHKLSTEKIFFTSVSRSWKGDGFDSCTFLGVGAQRDKPLSRRRGKKESRCVEWVILAWKFSNTNSDKKKSLKKICISTILPRQRRHTEFLQDCRLCKKASIFLSQWQFAGCVFNLALFDRAHKTGWYSLDNNRKKAFDVHEFQKYLITAIGTHSWNAIICSGNTPIYFVAEQEKWNCKKSHPASSSDLTQIWTRVLVWASLRSLSSGSHLEDAVCRCCSAQTPTTPCRWTFGRWNVALAHLNLKKRDAKQSWVATFNFQCFCRKNKHKIFFVHSHKWSIHQTPRPPKRHKNLTR